MEDKNTKIITNQHIKKYLCRAGFILLAIIICAASSFSYAKYISSKNSNNNANVAGMGIDVFELVAPEDDDYKWTTFETAYTGGGIGAHYSTIVNYNQVVPGADIPAPYIRLKLNSEVSYRLYVKIKIIYKAVVDANGDIIDKRIPFYIINDGERHESIYYRPSEDPEKGWEQVGEGPETSIIKEGPYKDNGYDTYTYRSKIYKAGDRYEGTYSDGENKGEFNGESIKVSILENDVIFVSQYYGYKGKYDVDGNGPNKGNTESFSIEFEAFIRQVLD